MLGFRIGFILFPIIVVLGFAGFFAYRYVYIQTLTPFVPTSVSVTLEPPKQAVTGTLKLKNGEVTQKTRESEDFQEATPGGTIRQGESVATKQGTTIISLEQIGTVFIGNNSELAAVNLIPGENVFLQKSGTVQYESASAYPLSVRVLHTLSEVAGNATISMSGSTISLRVTKGVTKLALVDANNDTKVWSILMGQQAVIHDVRGNVTVR